MRKAGKGTDAQLCRELAHSLNHCPGILSKDERMKELSSNCSCKGKEDAFLDNNAKKIKQPRTNNGGEAADKATQITDDEDYKE
uniref:Uncharacterized protein n=1 Tax=Oryza brachyantha TaxID=4533 RepID=J3MYS5_ORYBR